LSVQGGKSDEIRGSKSEGSITDLRDGGNAKIGALIFDSYSSSNSFSFSTGKSGASFINYINFTGLGFTTIFLLKEKMN